MRDRAQATPAMIKDGAVAISDVPHVRALLIATARVREPFTYAGLLEALGHPFTRPRMRALCRTLDAIDEAGRAAGEPELAVLVVRQSDGLPGQGWWVGRGAEEPPYVGSWTGPEALAFVATRQEAAYGFWDGDVRSITPRQRPAKLSPQLRARAGSSSDKP